MSGAPREPHAEAGRELSDWQRVASEAYRIMDDAKRLLDAKANARDIELYTEVVAFAEAMKTIAAKRCELREGAEP